jgi:hypothetical protein
VIGGVPFGRQADGEPRDDLAEQRSREAERARIASEDAARAGGGPGGALLGAPKGTERSDLRRPGWVAEPRMTEKPRSGRPWGLSHFKCRGIGHSGPENGGFGRETSGTPSAGRPA